MSVKETQDVAGFGFQKTGAQGQAPQSQTSVNASVVRPVSVKLVVTSSLNQYNSPSAPLSPVDPSLRLPVGLNCAMIDGTPTMPEISAQVVDANTGQPVASGTSQFNLRLQFDQMIGTPGVQTAVDVPYSWDLVPNGPLQFYSASSPWKVRPSRILGGNGTISWYYNSVAQTPFSFCVQSYNPSYSDFYALTGGGRYWFAPLVSNHEANGSNVCEPGRMQAVWCGGGY